MNSACWSAWQQYLCWWPKRAFLSPIPFPENITFTSRCVTWTGTRRQGLNKTVSPHSTTEYRHFLNHAVKYCSMAVKYNEGPWKDASPFLREREHFLEPCLWPVIFTSSYYSLKWHERTCKVKSRRMVGIWRSKDKVRTLMVAFDLLELCWERRKEPNLPHISIADHTGKKKSSLQNLHFSAQMGPKYWKNINF